MRKKWMDKLRKNVYTWFLAKLVLFFVTLFLLDLIIGDLLHFFYFRQKSGMLYRTTYAMEKTTADVVVLGSSAARHNYDPRIFKSALSMSTFNAGMDGNSIFYSDAVLKSMLKRYSPKMLILDFGYAELRKNQDDYDKLSALLPYYKTHPEIRPIADLKSRYEKLKMLSQIYPFNSLVVSVLTGNLQRSDGQPDIDGYVPLSTTWNEPMKDGATYPDRELDSNKISIYRSFISDCIGKKLKLYIIVSPVFIDTNYTNEIVQLGQRIATENNIPFFDFSKNTSFLKRPELFADMSHLNEKGAEAFSRSVIDTIRKVQLFYK